MHLTKVAVLTRLSSGMTEIGAASMQSPLQRNYDGSCGQMLPGNVGKVVKADGTFAGPGERGELVMSGPSMGLGYVGDEEA
jgi:4-coumarate--CoA ligase